MDPTVVIKYVREQRRQINDTYNTQQKLSPNSSSISPNSTSPNTMFQAPQAPLMRSRYPNTYPVDQNYAQKQMNKMDMNNNYAQKMMYNGMQKPELDMCMMNRSIQNSSQKADSYYHQMQMTNEAINRSASVKSDSGIGSNSPSSDNSDYNSNYMMQKNYKPVQSHLPQLQQQQQQPPQHQQQQPQMMSPSHPFQMTKKRKNSYDDSNLYPNKIDNMQDKAYQNYAKNIPDNMNMNMFNANNNKVPLHNSYYANQQICDKDCCAHLKQMNVQKPIAPKQTPNNVKSHYCDCKECNDLLNKKNYPGQMQPPMAHIQPQISLPPGYCDCPSCNLALANNSKIDAKNNHHSLVAPKPVMANPLPPVPTNRFVISQNSSFSPIAPTVQKYPQHIDPNYKFKKDGFNRYDTMPQEHGLNKCSCPECLKFKPGESSPKQIFSPKPSNHQSTGLVKIAKPQVPHTPQPQQNHYQQKPKITQQTGLTLPVVLAADLANYENYQNIIKQKNSFYNEMAKRKLEEEPQNKQPSQPIYYKKNRILNHDVNNHTINTNIPINREQENNDGVICLNKDDIELGEVVNVNKVNGEQILKSGSQETLIESFNRDSESPVAISKKMMPMISKRTNDWLEKSVEFTYNLSQISGLSLEKLFNILLKSWSKLLLVYMIENNLEFYVTKDYSIETKTVSYPKERDASGLLEIINRGHQELGLENQGYNLLKEIVLLNEGADDIQFSVRLNMANTRLKETLSSGHDSRYEKLVAFLPNIHNIKSNVIENLFYKNSPVQDILNRKLSDLLNKRPENVVE